MKVVYTKTALRDLEKLYEYHAKTWPGIAARFTMRLNTIERHMSDFPHGAPTLFSRPDVRVIGFGSFPYRLFYRARGNTIEVLTIRHTSRRPWAG